MSSTMAMSMRPQPQSYERSLLDASKERRARMAAKAVPDTGIDLQRGRVPGVTMTPVLIPPEPGRPVAAPQAPVKCRTRPVTPDLISRVINVQRVVAAVHNVTRGDILSRDRTAKVVRARQIATYAVKTLTTLTLPAIAARFGGMDHSTVIHSVRKITRLRAEDPDIAASISTIALTLADLGMDVSALMAAAVAVDQPIRRAF